MDIIIRRLTKVRPFSARKCPSKKREAGEHDGKETKAAAEQLIATLRPSILDVTKAVLSEMDN